MPKGSLKNDEVEWIQDTEKKIHLQVICNRIKGFRFGKKSRKKVRKENEKESNEL